MLELWPNPEEFGYMCLSGSDAIFIDISRAGYDEKSIIFKNFNLTVKIGEYLGLYGSNGTGKTTLLRAIAGIFPPVFYGDIKVKGRVGYVFQNPDNQIIGATVEEDIRFGLENLALNCETVEKRLQETLTTFGLQEFRAKDTLTLSGGQKQRLAIAAIMSLNPEILLFDEPFSMLDRMERRSMMNLVKSLRAKQITVVLASTNMKDLVFCDRIITLDGGRSHDQVQ
ncbi:energy-coupling factor ABC transporter ATP-binding protein [Kosmotoga arenicorallina]|nr:ABC transporter ATP-binding protein [Kosmotoga arenicorallina]